MEQELKQPEQLVKNDAIEGTPFRRVTTVEGTAVIIGLHRLSPWLKSEDDVLPWLEANKWEVVGMVAARIAELAIKKHDQEKAGVVNNSI